MVTGILLYLAFIRLLHSDYHIEGGAMLLTASIAVCANLLYVPAWSGRYVGLRARGPLGWERQLALHSLTDTQQAHTVLSSLLCGCLKRDWGGDLKFRVNRNLLKASCVVATLAGGFRQYYFIQSLQPPQEVGCITPRILNEIEPER